MKIAIVYWTYNKDYEYLILTLHAIPYLKRRYPDTVIDVYVFDDANFPCTEKFPDFINYKQTTFNRNGNLNGLNCIINILEEYKKLSNDYDWVIKCDCDTYINNLDVIHKTQLQKYGLIGTHNFYGTPYGCLVAYSKESIQFLSSVNLFYESYKILQSLLPNINRVCDDLIFNRLIIKHFNYINIPVYYNSDRTRKNPGLFPGILEYYNSKQYSFKSFDPNIKDFIKHWGITFKRCTAPALKDEKALNFIRVFGLQKLNTYIRKLKKYLNEE